MARILIAGPRYDDSFVDNVACALEEMGHEVSTSAPARTGTRVWSRRVRAVVSGMVSRSFRGSPGLEDRLLLRRVQTFRPHLLLALTTTIHPEVLLATKRMSGCPRVLWWGDAPANASGWGLPNPEWDTVYLKDKDAVAKMRLLGREAHLLHEAMNPRWHRPIAECTTNDVLVMGNYYAFRQAMVTALLDRDVPVAAYGPTPPRWSDPRILALWRRKYLTRLDKSRAIGECLAVLNTFSFAEGNSLNCRAFEVAGAGGLQLLEYRPIVTDCFEPGAELLTFRTLEELLERIRWAQREQAGARRIRAAGARRALAQHTYRHRLEVILRGAGLPSQVST
jgi:spore maturation protein CgeB